MPLLQITQSTVECPWAGSTSIDVCVSCSQLHSLHRSHQREFVRCATTTEGMEAFLRFQEEPGRLGRIVRHRVA